MDRPKWERMLSGDTIAVEQWEPETMFKSMSAAKETAHPFEIMIMGHYRLSYGRYSATIHSSLQGNTILGPPFDEELLWMSILAVAQRLCELVNYEQVAAQRLIARVITSLVDRARFESLPRVGELVHLLGGGGGCIVEVAPDGTVVVVENETESRREIRRSLEAFPRHS